MGGRPAISAAELRMTAVAHRDIAEPSVNDQIDEHGERQNAVCDQIASEPIERGADARTENHHREANLGIEVLSDVKIGPTADRTRVDFGIGPHGLAERQWNLTAAPPASDGIRRLGGIDREAGVALRALGDDVHAARRGCSWTRADIWPAPHRRSR